MKLATDARVSRGVTALGVHFITGGPFESPVNCFHCGRPTTIVAITDPNNKEEGAVLCLVCFLGLCGALEKLRACAEEAGDPLPPGSELWKGRPA